MRTVLIALLLQGCALAVQATGELHLEDDAVWIRSGNGKQRALVLAGDAHALARAPGALAHIEGTLRRGAIEVEAWRITEGPGGLAAWVGRVVVVGDRIALDVRGSDLVVGVAGPSVDALSRHVGELVLLEGALSGPAEVTVFAWRSLQ